MHSYVVEEHGNITDLFSFNIRPSLAQSESSPHRHLQLAYSYLNISPTLRLPRGLAAMLVIARDLGADLFVCPQMLQNNEKTLRELQFRESGDVE